MDSGQLLSDAMVLMVLGMGTVFVFLIILVFVTAAMSGLVMKYAPATPVDTTPVAMSSQPEEQTLLAVISASIHAHRNRQ